MAQHCTRLAPSPTGALHLGNARTFLINWALARQQGWKVVLRIEDLDSPRVKQGSAQGLIDTLNWLGLDWDEGPYFQSHDLRPYHTALAALADSGAIYPCRCTRSEILAASLSAPHQGEHELRYPGTCRPPEPEPTLFPATDSPEAGWRVRVPKGSRTLHDEFAGQVTLDVEQSVGDFLVATKGGTPSYQLAVVVDDLRQGVDCVVRGADLLASMARQRWLYDLLGQELIPRYWHLPLVIGTDGRRLAKRHGDTRLDTYRAAGVSAERIVGLLAHWSGEEELRELTARQFLARFDLSRLAHEPVVFAPQWDSWLGKTN